MYSKKIKKLALFVITMVMFVQYGSVGAVTTRETEALNDDFEGTKHVIGSMPASPWESTAHSSATVTVEQVNGNKRAAFTVSNRTGQVNRTLKVPFANSFTDKVIIKATMNVPEKTVQRYINIRNLTNNTSHKLVDFATTGNMLSGGMGLGAYQFGVDYNFMFVIDVKNGLYDVYMNDMTTPATTNRPLTSTVTQIYQLEFVLYAASVSALSSVTYVDNVEVIKKEPLHIYSYPENNQTDVQLGTDVTIKSNTDFVLSTLNTTNITDSGANIIDSIITNESQANVFTIKLNESVKPNTTYTISLNNIETTLDGVIPAQNIIFTTETAKNYWFTENFQNSNYEEKTQPNGWTTTIADGTIGNALIVGESNSANRYAYLNQSTVGNVRTLKTFANGSYQLSVADEVHINCKVLLDADTSTTGVYKQLRLLTAGKSPMVLLNFKSISGSKYVSYYNSATEVTTSIKLENTNDWLDVQIVLDTNPLTRNVTATVNGIAIEGNGTYASNITHINGLDIYTSTSTAGRYDGFGIDDIKIYPVGTDYITKDVKLYLNYGSEEQQEISNLQAGNVTVAGSIKNRTASPILVTLAGYKNNALVSVAISGEIAAGSTDNIFTFPILIGEQVDEIKLFYWDGLITVRPLLQQDEYYISEMN